MKINIKPLERLHEAYLRDAGLPEEVRSLVARYNTFRRDKKEGKLSEDESAKIWEDIVHSLFLLVGVDVSEEEPDFSVAADTAAAKTGERSEEEWLKEFVDRLSMRICNQDSILLKNRFDRLVLFQTNKIMDENLYQRELQRIIYAAETMDQDFPDENTDGKENPAANEKIRLCIGDIKERIGWMRAKFDGRVAGEQIKLIEEQYEKNQRDLKLGLVPVEEYLLQLSRMDFALVSIAENLLG